MSFLDKSVEWYRQVAAEAALADGPQERLIATSNRKLADQYLRLAFQYARAEAALLGSKGGADENSEQQSSSTRTRLLNSIAESDARIADLQKQLTDVESRIDTARGDTLRQLSARQEILKSELALAQARKETAATFLGYVQSLDTRSGGRATLSARIDELERGTPELRSATTLADTSADAKDASKDGTKDSGKDTTRDSARDSTKDNTSASADNTAVTTSATTTQSDKSSGSGLASALGSLLRIRREISTIDSDLRATSQLSDARRKLVTPLVQQLNAAAQQGQSLADESDSADPQLALANKAQIDQITKQFKQISAVTLPLGRAGLILNGYQANLTDWRKMMEEDGKRLFYEVVLRICIVGAVILVILAFSNVWRRATIRLIGDTRRRSQVLLIRRIVVTTLITMVIAFAVVSETGSLATYAGLVTAGLAVALQNIILSLIAYFFLIGRYGVHVGDRVTISGVTGEVLEIGLLRLHMTELGGDPSDLHATGRIVVFSNAVILQPTSYLFKQAPMTNFVWHDMKVTCPVASACEDTRDRIVQALTPIYSGEVAEGKTSGWSGPQPVVRVLVGESGAKLLVRYPVSVRGNSDLDERVSRAVLSAVQTVDAAK